MFKYNLLRSNIWQYNFKPPRRQITLFHAFSSRGTESLALTNVIRPIQLHPGNTSVSIIVNHKNSSSPNDEPDTRNVTSRISSFFFFLALGFDRTDRIDPFGIGRKTSKKRTVVKVNRGSSLPSELPSGGWLLTGQ